MQLKFYFFVSGDKREEKENEIRELEREINNMEKAIKSKSTAHRAKMQKLHSDLSHANELGRYSQAIVNLVQDIENNIKLFKSKPIGKTIF